MYDMQLSELHKKLQSHLDAQRKNWKSFIYAQDKGFYQGFDEIQIDGWRPTEKRFINYDIENYLNKNKTVLDIGCNCGFFTLHSSKYVKHIDGVEINPYLVNIANDVKDFLKIQNTAFHNSSFETFTTDKKYDIVYSFANDSTIDANTTFNFSEYVNKILRLLENNGLLIFESQAADNMPPEKFTLKFNFLSSKFKILENRLVNSEYPVNVPQRIFLILQKITNS